MTKLTIEGTLTTITPLNVRQPGGFKLTEDERIVSENNPLGKKPANPTVKFPLVSAARPVNGNGKEGNGEEVARVPYLPYFPSNDFRGHLRQACCQALWEQIAGKGTLSLAAYHGLTSGSTGGSDIGEDKSLQEVRDAHKHIFMGLFGGGPRLLRSGLYTSDLVPILPETIKAGIVPDRERENAANVRWFSDLTYIIHCFKHDQALLFLDPRADKVIANYEETIVNHQIAVLNERGENAKAKKSAADAAAEKTKAREEKRKAETIEVTEVKRNRIENMFAIEAVAPGTPFYVRLGFADWVQPYHVGFIAAALERFANTNAIGGNVTKGFGRFQINLSLFDDSGKRKLLQSTDGKYTVASDISDYTEAFRKEMSKVNVEGIEAFFKSLKKAA